MSLQAGESGLFALVVNTWAGLFLLVLAVVGPWVFARLGGGGYIDVSDRIHEMTSGQQVLLYLSVCALIALVLAVVGISAVKLVRRARESS